MARVAFIQKSAYEKVSIHFLAGALRQHGIEYDVFVEDLEQDFFGSIVAYDPTHVLYSLFIGEEEYAFGYFKKLKQLLPQAKTVVGGPYVLIFGDVHLQPEVDYSFKGDSEDTLPAFLKRQDLGQDVRDIGGISFVDAQGQEHRNTAYGLADVNATPGPDRDLYYKYPALRANPTKTFIASRGCAYKCTYCYNAELSDHYKESYWRQRSVESVIKEIRHVRDRHGLDWVHFQDGTFNTGRPWLLAFLEAYRATDLPPFLCNARVENIDDGVARALKEARCDRITFGIQSGNEQIRHAIAGRKMSNKKIIEACALCKKYGIRVGVDIIFGWPGETLEQALETIRLCRTIDVESYSSNVLIFYPGLRITSYAYEGGYIQSIPKLTDIAALTPNTSLLTSGDKRLFINLDKLFNYLIRFPWLERPLLLLIKLPPNTFFNVLKNIHHLARSMKYDKAPSKLRLIGKYLTHSVNAVRSAPKARGVSEDHE